MLDLAEANSSNERLILKSAIELFAVKGFEETSIRDICDSAGVSRPVLYYYFGSKDGLTSAVVQHMCHHLRYLLSSALDSQVNFREQCLALIRLLFQDATENPLLWRLLLARVSYPAKDNDVAQLCGDFDQWLHEAATLAVQRGELGNVEVSVVAPIIAGAVAMTAMKYLYTGTPRLSLALSETIVETVFRGWGCSTVCGLCPQ